MGLFILAAFVIAVVGVLVAGEFDSPLGAAIVVGVAAVLFTVGTMGDCGDRGHEILGSKGHTCFANRTCRDKLRCADDGHDGVCVQP